MKTVSFADLDEEYYSAEDEIVELNDTVNQKVDFNAK